jgi:hypothetical protein
MANAITRKRFVGLTLCLLAAAGAVVGLNRLALADDPPKDAPKPAEIKKPAIVTPSNLPEQVRVINERIAEKWHSEKLTPSPRCSDYDFIRRASLDIIGRIATLEEIDRYMKDPPTTRRSQLIDRLLKSEEYASNWATIWTTWLMTRSGPADYHKQMHLWLEEQFSKQNCGFDRVVFELLTAKGKTKENGAVNFILSNLGEPTKPDNAKEEGNFSFVPATSRTTRLFLGLQTQCTQCHDHPFKAQWKQKHFWGTNAFFRQVVRKGNPAMTRNMPEAPELTLDEDPTVNLDEEQKTGIVFYERRNGVLMTTGPAFLLDNKKTPPKPGVSRRELLADAIIKSDYFPKAYVNRLWAHFFGHGMNSPGSFDDFGEDNQITHPELMDYLANEFRAYQFNPRELIKWICNSEAYNLSSASNSTNEKAEAEPFFSRMLLKAMTPEQLFESLMVATEAEAAETKDAKRKLRDRWMQKLIVNFGDDEGNEVTFNGTVVQALIMMNGNEINDAISHKTKGPVARAAKKRAGNKAIMDTIYLAVLNRLPNQTESQKIQAHTRIRSERDPYAPWQDLQWALLNSNEFILNH